MASVQGACSLPAGGRGPAWITSGLSRTRCARQQLALLGGGPGRPSAQGGGYREKVLERLRESDFLPKPALANAAGIGCLGLMGSFKAYAGKCTLYPLLQFYKVLHTLLRIGAVAALTPAN